MGLGQSRRTVADRSFSLRLGGFDLTTAPVEVRVRNRIALTAQPADQAIPPGGTAVFTVSAAGMLGLAALTGALAGRRGRGVRR